MNGIQVSVTHSDFSGEASRKDFIDRFLGGWEEVKGTQGVKLTPICQLGEEDEAVTLFFSYGENSLNVRDAELATSCAMAALALHAVEMNQKTGDLFPAYGMSVQRDVPMPSSSSS